jgi:hypothetical protein
MCASYFLLTLTHAKIEIMGRCEVKHQLVSPPHGSIIVTGQSKLINHICDLPFWKVWYHVSCAHSKVRSKTQFGATYLKSKLHPN